MVRVIGLVIAGTLLCVEAVAGDVVLDGSTRIEVVERGDFGDAAGRLSELLESYVRQAVENRNVSGTSRNDAAADIRFVIEATAQRWSDLPAGAIADPGQIDAFAIEVLGGATPEVQLRGKTVSAAAFAVMHFLEERLGYLWAMPGELGLCKPRTNRFVLEEGVERVAPAMISRGTTGFVLRDSAASLRGLNRSGLLQEMRGFFFSHDYFKALKLNPLASPSHNMIRIVSPAMAELEPDVFPMVRGKRWVPPLKEVAGRGGANAWQSFHPCYSSPRLLELTVTKANETYEAGGYCFSLGINDGRCVGCECEACVARGFPDSYYGYVQRVGEAIAARWPGRLVGLIAYGDVKVPPTDLILPPNVLVMVVGGGPGAIDLWSKHAQLVGTYEHFFGMGWWYPNLPLASMKANATFYATRGVRSYRGEWHPLWAWDGPRVWIGAKLLWNPELDVDAAMARFCQAAFGEAAAEMEAFYRTFASLRDGWVVPQGVSTLLGPSGAEKLYLDPMRQFAFPKEVFAEASGHLNEAMAKAADANAPVKQRVTMVKTFFELGQTVRQMMELADNAFDPTTEAPRAAQLRDLLAQRAALLAEMRDHPEWFAGTGTGVDEAGRPMWFERSVVDVVRMSENAILAAESRHALRSESVEPLRMLVKRTHAWYEDERKFVPLSTSGGRDSVRFEAGSRGTGESDHPKWIGARKHHWMAALVRDVTADKSGAVAIDFQATGVRGRLTLRATVKNAGRAEPAVMVLADFANTTTTVTRRLLVEPVVGGERESSDVVRAPAESARAAGRSRVAAVDIHVIWEPGGDDARLSGEMKVQRVVWQTTSAQAACNKD